MRKLRPVKIKIDHQGGPRVNMGYVEASGPRIAAIVIDLHSKRCEVYSTGCDDCGCPVIDVIGGSEGLHLKKGVEDRLTEVSFPGFKGFSVFSASITKYTLWVCLTKAWRRT